MPLINAVEWVNPGEDELAARYPNVSIKYGSQLTVMENQWGVLFKDGKALDVFEPGRHTITSKNIPFLTDLVKRLGIIGDIFDCEVVFVNKSQARVNFGGRAYSAPSGQVMYQAEIGFYGYMIIRVEDPRLFVTEFFGNRNATDTAEVSEFIRGFAIEKIMSSFGHHDIFSLVKNFSVISREILSPINSDSKGIGLRVVNSLFEGVDIPEEARRFASGMGRQAMAMQYTKETAEVMPGDGGAAGAGLGAGLGIAMGQKMMDMGGQQPPSRVLVCPKCGAENDAGNRFCGVCGSEMAAQKTVVCSFCGYQMRLGDRFCGRCGKPAASESKCPRCGAVNQSGSRFCRECGEKLGEA
ncbi:SPFH domain-containing protein [Candidatus Bathyarchaeota archaeon]|nr:SPFH domain-containing protein [Candidatus Bathyarchaeota archaeon]